MHAESEVIALALRRGSVLFEAVLAVVLGALLLVPAGTLLGQVLKSSDRVAVAELDAFEAVLARVAASTPPEGVTVDPAGTGRPDAVRLTWRTAYRGGVARQVTFLLSGSELVADDGTLARVLASGVSLVSFSARPGVLGVHAEGAGWQWDREFALLGGG